MPRPDKVCLGTIVGVHGVQGAVRIKSFTADPADVAAYGAVSDESGGRRFEVRVLGQARGTVLARLSGVADRNAAEALRGLRLYVPRAALPEANEDEFYHADLIGLPVETREGAPLGSVRAVLNFGAGDILELRDENGREILLPFSDAAVPEVDLARGRIVASPPEGLLEQRAPAAAEAGGGAARRRRRKRRAAGGGAGAGGGGADRGGAGL
ncbi:MAG: ribosome maturation factor RimM [Alphaproteobacteria bacterium]